MVWFKVDDGLHKHRKVRKALAGDPASMSLWVVAGSWSSDEGTDGFIPDDQLPWLLPAGAQSLARVLVAARLWIRVRGGYQFHQWEEDGDGTRRNPTRADVEATRRTKAEAGRKGGLASGKTRSNGQAPAEADAKHLLGVSLNPRPDPTRPKEGGSSKRSTHVARDPGPEPPRRCEEHLHDDDPPPCGRCAEARKAHEAWERARILADAEQRSAAARDRAIANQAAIAACDLCDRRGYRNGRVCDHDPGTADRATRGAAAARDKIRRSA